MLCLLAHSRGTKNIGDNLKSSYENFELNLLKSRKKKKQQCERMSNANTVGSLQVPTM